MKKSALLMMACSITFFIACDKKTDISEVNITALPSAIITYVNTNYVGYTIEEVENDTLCDGTIGIELELEKQNAEDISLFFSNENIFILKEEEIKYNTLPTGVQTFFSTNYPNYKLPEDADKITLANGTVQYEVDIKEKTTKIEKEVITNLDGTAKICER
jgi:Putative beta-lactamase-inhibitor-like, PepSY-like